MLQSITEKYRPKSINDLVFVNKTFETKAKQITGYDPEVPFNVVIGEDKRISMKEYNNYIEIVDEYLDKYMTLI